MSELELPADDVAWILVPNLRGLPDAELQRLFPHLDGAWSAQTKKLLARFRTERLHLNDNWASERPSWQCPACRRGKRQIARLTAAGVLLCQLDLHHDHLGDRAKQVVRARNPVPPGDEGFALFQAFDTAKGIVERFHSTIVCHDCNTAEGRAKRELAGVVHSDFSFSPEEIGQFVRAKPNAPHELDLNRARALWAAAQPTFEADLAFIDVLAERVARGHHRKKGFPVRLGAAQSTAGLLLFLARDQGKADAHLESLGQHLWARSVSRDGVDATNSRTRRAATPPTDAQAEAFDARQDHTTTWRKVPMDWACPACSRNRRAILRTSNAGAWTGQLFGLLVHVEETDPFSLGYRGGEGDLIYGAHRSVFICQDCREIITKVKTVAPHISEQAFSPSDLADLLIASGPNMRHHYELDAAVRRGEANAKRQRAAKAYWAHRMAAASARSVVRGHSDYFRIDYEEAIVEVVLERTGEGADPEDVAACLDELRWMLSEAARFDALNDRGAPT